ncbi:hypothetical protein P691DRAFT_764625 [Macrolepiota fuliginosa MF-IS2]|uniref:Uncharacterized protein n=1 Tax=Macrolepiota fuliginosa MF-IS2 TaxID=1400762 RepID=A0A9P6BWM2_9AGAR|nr:hypothetical protein P691DRAFT_764625 [Macrolepiota fuliginosa MF-IS2]
MPGTIVKIVHQLHMKTSANTLLALVTPNRCQMRPNWVEDVPDQDPDGPPHAYPNLYSPFYKKQAKTPGIGLTN